MKAVLLAAGESSRFWPLNSRHKALFRIMGKPIIQYAIDSLKQAGIKEIIIIEGPSKFVENEVDQQSGVSYVVQSEPKGMGNALLQAESLLDEDFIVLNAERFDAGDFARQMIEKKKSSKSDYVMLGSKTEEPWLFGILEIENGYAKGIVEKPKRGEEKSNIKAAGIYLLDKGFFGYYKNITEHMYAFEEALGKMMNEKSISVIVTERNITPLKYPWHLFDYTKALMDKHLKKSIPRTVDIRKNVIIEGNVSIGKGTIIFENAVIKGPCYIGDDCIIGNNAVIREYANVENLSMVGANCEVARSILGDNVHVHSGYIGDSIISANCRIGAGIITANVRLDRGIVKAVVKGEKIDTGRKSLGFIVGENSSIGIGARTMPGVMIGRDCIVGPCSMIDKNVDSCKNVYAKLESFSRE